jgi:hypothetical protein
MARSLRNEAALFVKTRLCEQPFLECGDAGLVARMRPVDDAIREIIREAVAGRPLEPSFVEKLEGRPGN